MNSFDPQRRIPQHKRSRKQLFDYKHGCTIPSSVSYQNPGWAYNIKHLPVINMIMCSESTLIYKLGDSPWYKASNPEAGEMSQGPFVTNEKRIFCCLFLTHCTTQQEAIFYVLQSTRLTALIPGTLLCWYLFSISILWDRYWFFSMGGFHKLRYPTNSRKNMTAHGCVIWSNLKTFKS